MNETNAAVDALERRAVRLSKSGDAGAYEYLVAKYLRRVVSIAWGVVRNAHDAEDLAQEAFVKAFQSMGRFQEDQPFGPWIYRIVTNLSLDLLKWRARHPQEELTTNEPAQRRDAADTRAIAGDIARRIDSAIETLPDMQRIVARLHLVEEFEHHEISSMTGLSEGTIRSHLSLAKKKLREELADLYGGHDE